MNTPTAQEKGNAARQRLLDGVRALTSGDDFKAWLKAMRRFHQYSPGNVMLITMQMPDATRVAGFNTWKSMGRMVRKGEQGLTILAPNFIHFDDEQGDGTVVRRQRLIGFLPVYVFDISQTDGKPLPEGPRPVILTDESPTLDVIWERLKTYNQSQGIEVTVEPMTDSSNGYYILTPNHHKIAIKRGNPRAQKVKTLIHETAHALRMSVPVERNYEVEEVIAEGAAYLVMDEYGMASDEYSMPYVAAWSGGDPDAVLKVMDTINKIAGQIIDAIGEVG